IPWVRQLLIHRVSVVVVVHVVEAEHHLAHRSTVNKDQRRARLGPFGFAQGRLARRPSLHLRLELWLEQLSVDLPPVRGFKDYLFRHDQSGRGAAGGPPTLCDHLASPRTDEGGHPRSRGRRTPTNHLPRGFHARPLPAPPA